MKLIAITESSGADVYLGDLQIATNIPLGNSQKVHIRGVLNANGNDQGSIKWYFLGDVKLISKQVKISNRKIKTEQAICSVLTMQYHSAKATPFQFSFIAEVNDDFPTNEVEPLFGLFLGDKRVSSVLLRDFVWDNIINIKQLTTTLLYPRLLPTRFIRPIPEQLADSTNNELKIALKKLLDDQANNEELSLWSAQQINSHNPFEVRFAFLEELLDEEWGKRKRDANPPRRKQKRDDPQKIIMGVLVVIIIILSIFLLSVSGT